MNNTGRPVRATFSDMAIGARSSMRRFSKTFCCWPTMLLVLGWPSLVGKFGKLLSAIYFQKKIETKPLPE
jgi:hypothetical protein